MRPEDLLWIWLPTGTCLRQMANIPDCSIRHYEFTVMKTLSTIPTRYEAGPLAEYFNRIILYEKYQADPRHGQGDVKVNSKPVAFIKSPRLIDQRYRLM